MNLPELFQTVLSMSIMGSIVLGIILLIKGLLRNKISAAWHYYIWFLILIRLVVPYAPQSSFSLFNLIPQVSQSMEISVDLQDNSGRQGASIDLNNRESASDGFISQGTYKNPGEIMSKKGLLHGYPKFGLSIISYVWLAGMLVFFIITLGGYLILLKRLKGQPQCDDENIIQTLVRCCRIMKVKPSPPIIYYGDAKVPSLLGYFKPKILIAPEAASSLSSEELEHVLLHEIAHLKRNDILINWLMVFIQGLHWFNPLVWYAFRKVRQDCEVLCDAHVLARLDPVKHKKYGETIISLLRLLSKPYWIPGTIGLARNKNEIKRRIIMIKMFKKVPFRWTIITAAVVVLAGIIILTNPKGTAFNARPNAGDNSQDLVSEEPNVQENAIEDAETEENAETVEETPEAKVEAEPDPSFPEQPQVLVEVDMEIVERDQAQVDKGHSPWQLSPYAVTQTFVSLQISPEGVNGEFPVDMEDMKIVFESDEATIIEVNGDKTPIRKVYLKRLVKQDENGIWTVVGYDPIED